MLFYTWMKKKYLNEKGAKGCLARSMKADGFFFPKQGRHRKVRVYLEQCREADQSILDAFEDCWKEYENDERERIGKKACARS